jgi:hypothetical protein
MRGLRFVGEAKIVACPENCQPVLIHPPALDCVLRFRLIPDIVEDLIKKFDLTPSVNITQ